MFQPDQLSPVSNYFPQLVNQTFIRMTLILQVDLILASELFDNRTSSGVGRWVGGWDMVVIRLFSYACHLYNRNHQFDSACSELHLTSTWSPRILL